VKKVLFLLLLSFPFNLPSFDHCDYLWHKLVWFIFIVNVAQKPDGFGIRITEQQTCLFQSVLFYMCFYQN
jgi:hypothetical protein